MDSAPSFSSLTSSSTAANTAPDIRKIEPFHICRSNQLPLTFALLSRCFVLGLFGVCLVQVCAYIGIGYSSPTLAAALGNLIPGFTFLLAIIFRLEKLEPRRSSSQAKALGTLVAILGAFVMTLYEGPSISFNVFPESPHYHQALLSQQSTSWVLGGLIIALAALFYSIWNVFQAATIKVYPDETTIVFFLRFGTIQCTIFALLVERNPAAWVLSPGIPLIAILYSAIAGGVFRIGVVTWCLRKKGPVFVTLFKPIQIVISAISGIMFLGDTLQLGSVIGGSTIAVGFYTVMWGLAKEKKMEVDIVSSLESSTHKSPLLKTNTHGESPK